MEETYDRKRVNLFGIPNSVRRNRKAKMNKLKINSDFSVVSVNSSQKKDVNQMLVELFEDNNFEQICKTEDKKQFVNYLYKNGILSVAAQSGISDKNGWLQAHAYVSTETVAVAALQVLAVVGVVAVAIITADDVNECKIEKSTYFETEIRNPILNICRILAYKFGSKKFSENVSELFNGLENGKYVINVSGV
ncbi:hypothetical protein PFZ79_002446 [Enterococcus hirae]|nr:hypothetical protein [Enterococcus hirae]